MHKFMIIIGIIGFKFVKTAPQQGYNYNNFNLATTIPISYTSTNTDDKLLPDNSQHQITNKPREYFNKQFFIHTAPDETFDETQAIHKIQNSLKKNLRVLFIKSPANNGLTNAAEQLAKEQTSEHTIIYVLNKYTDSAELQHKLDKLNDINPNKPEVHFVRYRTNNDIENAKNSIQSQYDKFGDGSFEIINEGIPDTISYIGSVNTNHQQLQQQQYQQQSSHQNSEFENSGISLVNGPTVINTYLPSSH